MTPLVILVPETGSTSGSVRWKLNFCGILMCASILRLSNYRKLGTLELQETLSTTLYSSIRNAGRSDPL
jgi:hypothetical protein